MNPYITDILSQPDALRKVVDHFSPMSLDPVTKQVRRGMIDRIILTGMGASYNAAYPAYIRLSGLSVPVLHVNAAELLHYLDGLIGTRTLLWMNSQSGRSAELVHLVERIKSISPVCLLSCVNDETSPLASAADICVPIYAGPETTVSTKTYINTLATNLLIAEYLLGNDTRKVKEAMLAVADATQSYLEGWNNHASILNAMLGDFRNMILVGRGPSMSTVWNGSLINKEAAKFQLEGMHAAEFRHGPLELVSSGFTALVFAGPSGTAQLNRNLALEIIKHGGRAIWIDSHIDAELPTIKIPDTDDLLQPLVEILPLQMLTLVMAERNQVSAGQFRHVTKITSLE